MAKKNYLDYIPKHNSRFPYKTLENGRVEVKVKNVGLFNRIAQLIFRRPPYSYIELDDFGTFVWNQIDGNRSIYEIGILVKEKYGDEAEPLYERLSKYFYILRRNEYVLFVNK